MFNVKEYLDRPYREECLEKEIEIGGRKETVRYRLLDGVDLVDLAARDRLGEKAAMILGLCVRDGEGGGPIGFANGRLMLRLYPGAGSELAAEIFTRSSEKITAEARIVEEEEKNSEGTSTAASIGGTADGTDSTRP